MFLLWSIVAILIIAIGAYVIGALSWDIDEKVGVSWAILFGALLWPLALTAVIIAGPLVGLFWLGDRRRRKLREVAEAAVGNQ